MTRTFKLLRFSPPYIAIILLTACGGSNTSGGATTYDVSTTAGAGGTVSPSSAPVTAGNTTTFTVTPNSGYVITSVTGCGGSLTGSTYSTGAVNANCTVTASFSAAFTWVGGSKTVDAPGVYGSLDVAASTNMPGARWGATSWTDVDGNLWLLGGLGYDSAGKDDKLNDLWEYSPSSNTWTWIGGSKTADATGVYGKLNVAAPSNIPGARYLATSWTDPGGNVWILGGFGYDSAGNQGYLNDLWEYSPSSNTWTWVSGSSTGEAQGVYDTSSAVPGARAVAARWTDASGNLWMFGGYGLDANRNTGYLNDLWEYSASTKAWTWLGGSQTANASGVYGTQGVAAKSNVPGGRDNAVTWMDSSGNLWLFGGTGYDSAGNSNFLNDLWEYSPSSEEWTWVGGSKTAGAKGVYGLLGIAAKSNMPGARYGATSWTDPQGNVWIFGGAGYDSEGLPGYLNDLWKYSPSSGEWTWVGAAGSNAANGEGVYGAQGVAAITNVPGARWEAVSWADANGNAWLFGGVGLDSTGKLDSLNDLWEYPTQ